MVARCRQGSARCPAAPAWLIFVGVLPVAFASDASCWSGSFTEELCCVGETGNPECWDGAEFTHERCCPDAEDAEGAGGRGDGNVLFNDHLAEVGRGIREALAEYSRLDAEGRADCREDGAVLSPALRAARGEVLEALRQSEPDPDVTAQLETPGVDEAYREYDSVLPLCPQARQPNDSTARTERTGLKRKSVIPFTVSQQGAHFAQDANSR